MKRLLGHILGVTGVTALILFATLLPFLPGRYDSLAVPLSGMARILGVVGLLLVPVGALWVASGYWSRLAGKQHTIAIAALVVSSLVWALVSLGALVSGLSLGVVSIGAWAYVASRLAPRVKRLKGAAPGPPNAIAYYLLVVPVAVVLLQVATVAPAIESSRERAIRNAAPLIADIERYRAANGGYPESLLSVWPDYLPGVIGIKEYFYEPKGDAYNVVFEQFALAVGTVEFVVYNPRDEQSVTSHKFDRARLTPQQLVVEQSRGHYAVHTARRPHWKYFWLD